jgi:hypothetical protein
MSAAPHVVSFPLPPGWEPYIARVEIVAVNRPRDYRDTQQVVFTGCLVMDPFWGRRWVPDDEWHGYRDRSIARMPLSPEPVLPLQQQLRDL